VKPRYELGFKNKAFGYLATAIGKISYLDWNALIKFDGSCKVGELFLGEWGNRTNM